jgi:hypothetical protein
MAITNIDELRTALKSGKCQILGFNKSANAGTQLAGGWTSFWTLAGYGTGATPTTPATCNNTTLGGMNFINPAGSEKLYIAESCSHVASSTTVTSFEIADRLAHMGGLSGIITTAQTVGLDLHTSGLGGTDNITARKGRSDFSEVRWFIEWYTATGATGTSFTVSYTNQNGTSGQTVTQSSGFPASTAARRMVEIFPSTSGDFIRSIESITLAATTGTAGNFGITAYRPLTEITCEMGSTPNILNWTNHALVPVENSACLSIIKIAEASTAVASSGYLKLIQG